MKKQIKDNGCGNIVTSLIPALKKVENLHYRFDAIPERSIRRFINKRGVDMVSLYGNRSDVPDELQEFFDIADLGQCHHVALKVIQKFQKSDYSDRFDYVFCYPLFQNHDFKKTGSREFEWGGRHGVVLVDKKYVFDPIHMKHTNIEGSNTTCLVYRGVVLQNSFVRNAYHAPYVRNTKDLIKLAILRHKHFQNETFVTYDILNKELMLSKN